MPHAMDTYVLPWAQKIDATGMYRLVPMQRQCHFMFLGRLEKTASMGGMYGLVCASAAEIVIYVDFVKNIVHRIR